MKTISTLKSSLAALVLDISAHLKEHGVADAIIHSTHTIGLSFILKEPHLNEWRPSTNEPTDFGTYYVANPIWPKDVRIAYYGLLNSTLFPAENNSLVANWYENERSNILLGAGDNGVISWRTKIASDLSAMAAEARDIAINQFHDEQNSFSSVHENLIQKLTTVLRTKGVAEGVLISMASLAISRELEMLRVDSLSEENSAPAPSVDAAPARPMKMR